MMAPDRQALVTYAVLLLIYAIEPLTCKSDRIIFLWIMNGHKKIERNSWRSWKAVFMKNDALWQTSAGNACSPLVKLI